MATQGCSAPSYASGYRKGIALPPSLTLILPVWNRESELRREVEHLLEVLPEFVSSFELLIVDDGSDDHSTELAQQLSRQFPQVRSVEAGPSLSLPAVVAAAKRRTTDLVVVHDGPSLSAHDLQRLLAKSSQPTDMPSLSTSPQPLATALLGQLSKWGERLKEPVAGRRPANFLSHLRNLAGT